MVQNDELVEKCLDFCELAEKTAADKREDFVFSPEKSKDKKGHFPLSNANQARNALARSHQYTSNPPWHNGTLAALQEAVRRKVKAKFPSIEVSSPKKKATDVLYEVAAKYGQVAPAAASPVQPAQKTDPTAQLNQVLAPFGYSVLEGSKVQPLDAQFADVRIKSTPKSRWSGKGVLEKDEVKKLIDPVMMSALGLSAKPLIYT